MQFLLRAGTPTIGICGQAPADYPEFAEWLVERRITSISLNPDAAIKTALLIARAEAETAACRAEQAQSRVILKKAVVFTPSQCSPPLIGFRQLFEE